MSIYRLPNVHVSLLKLTLNFKLLSSLFLTQQHAQKGEWMNFQEATDTV